MEQFEQLLTCAICLDRYRNPKLLPCQHSFCMEPCMDGLVDYVRRQVKCPECRAEHRIPYQGVQAFPTNVTLQRFLELHIEITGELPDPTSGQIMERCGVCSEKSYCSLCVHCEKKCCTECKDAHMDILRREITRINSQIRRGLHRLQDALALVEKNTLGLQTNTASVAEEIDEIYRRLSKALKDRTEYLRNEIDRYLNSELRGLIQLKENLELEIANIQSNCDLAEAHINENVPWDDTELLDTKELFLRTVEFIRNFEYEAGDFSRRVRFVMTHDPNQLVLHVAGYGELNIKPEAGTVGLLGSTSGLAPPGGSPGLMRSKSDHRLASQYRQQEEDRHSRNRYVPDYEYDAPEYETPRNKSRYRSRFMRHRDGEDSDGDTRTGVRFNSAQDHTGLREKVLDTEDAARGPLSGIFRLTDSPRVMRKLQECERAGKRKKEEVAQPPPPTPRPQVQPVQRKAPTAMARQVSEDDEISRIKKQNKSSPSSTSDTTEERLSSAASLPTHPPLREQPEREAEETPRKTPIPSRRTSVEPHAQGPRSASSESSTGSESSGGSGVRNTGATFTTEEVKQKYLSKAPAATTNTSPITSTAGVTSRDSPITTTPRTFQSRFLGGGNRSAPPPPQTPAVVREEPPKKKEEEEEDDDDETSSSSEETESETEEESETETRTTPATAAQRTESAMAKTDIGPLLARSAEARRGSKEESPTTRYGTPRGSPAHTSPSVPTTPSTPPYTSRFVTNDHTFDVFDANTSNPLRHNRFRVFNAHDDDDDVANAEPPSATVVEKSKVASNERSNAGNSESDGASSSSSAASTSRNNESNVNSIARFEGTVCEKLATGREGTTSDSNEIDQDNKTDDPKGEVEPSPTVGDGGRSPKEEFLSAKDAEYRADLIEIFVEDEQWMADGEARNNMKNARNIAKLGDGNDELDSDENYSRTDERFETESERVTNNDRLMKFNESSVEEADDDDREEDSNEENYIVFKTESSNANPKKPEDNESLSKLKIPNGKSDLESGSDEEESSSTESARAIGNHRNYEKTEPEVDSEQTVKDIQVENMFDDNGWVVTDEGHETVFPKKTIFRQGSLGKNGWLVSDESETEVDAEEKDEINNNKLESDRRMDENGWAIDDDEDVVDSDHEEEKNKQDSNPSGDSPVKNDVANFGNGALGTNATQLIKRGSDEESAKEMSVPMKMVTTVFCVSVLCCSVLMNFFL